MFSIKIYEDTFRTLTWNAISINIFNLIVIVIKIEYEYLMLKQFSHDHYLKVVISTVCSPQLLNIWSELDRRAAELLFFPLQGRVRHANTCVYLSTLLPDWWNRRGTFLSLAKSKEVKFIIKNWIVTVLIIVLYIWAACFIRSRSELISRSSKIYGISG